MPTFTQASITRIAADVTLVPSMSHGFWRIAEEDPSRVAVIDDANTPHTAGALLASANQLVHALRGLGLQTGDVVAIATGNRVEFLALYMAALQAGWYFAPLNTGLTAREIAHVIGDARPKLLVVDARSAPAALPAAGSIPVFAVDDVPDTRPFATLLDGQPTSPPRDRVAGDRLFYTSGTTGLPKAVRRRIRGESPEQAARSAEAHLGGVAGIAPRSNAVHCVTSPLYHSASLLWCVDHLHLGHAVVLMEKWAPEPMLERIARHRVTGALMVPTHFHRLLALPDDVRTRHDVSSLRHIIHTGAACPIEVKRRMLAWWGPCLYEVYGAAEGGGTRIGPDEWLAHPGSVGKSHGRIRILRDDGTPCDANETGAVYMKLGTPFEYGGDPRKTAAARRGTFFTVGDLGHLDAEDYLFLDGRASDLIISGGTNIYPAEVEAVLATHPAVADVAVFGVPDEEWGERVKALVELRANVVADEAALIAYCRERLAHYKCPRTIVFIDRLPRDAAGKIRKHELRERYRD
jgi:long-chain acyl-CoA synthetase